MRAQHHTSTILALAAAGALGFSGLALAQQPPAPPAPTPPAATMPGPMAQHQPMRGPMAHQPMPGPMRGPMAGWMEGQGPQHWGHNWSEAGRHHGFMHRMDRMATWGLFGHHADLALTPTDVETIAQAILLRHGEHNWKVGDVTANADGTVSFAFLSEHGDVIARFAMNTTNGRITRTD